ncbi:MAG: glycosyltransferase [Pseudomonadota bacterium]
MSAKDAKAKPLVEGRLEGLEAGVAIGWVRDLQGLEHRPSEYRPPEYRPIVELLCDGYPVAFDRADTFRPDLPRQAGEDGCIGFQIGVPAAALRHGRRLSARLANTTLDLPGTIEIGAAGEAARAVLAGEVVSDGLRLSGWVMALDADRTVTLYAHEGERLLGETVARIAPAAIEDGAADPTARRFRLRLPSDLADGAVHWVHIRDEGGRELKGSPVAVAAWPGGVGEILERLASEEPVSETAKAQLAAVARLMDEGKPGRRASLDFAEYPAWAAAFAPVPATPLPPETSLTLVLYGPGDTERTQSALAAEADGGVVRIVAAPEGVLADWPEAGPVVAVRAGDRLAPGALARIVRALEGAAAAYADSEQTVAGQRLPWFKPGWDPDLLLAQGYVFGLLALDAGAAPPPPPGPVSLSERVLATLSGAKTVTHVGEILHDQGEIEAHGQAPVPPDWTSETLTRHWPGLDALQPLPATPWLWRTRWPRPDPAPTVEVLVPTRERADLLAHLLDGLARTDYPALRITVLDNGSTAPETLAYFERLQAEGTARVLPCPGPFNYAAINNRGAEASEATFLCLMNNDVGVLDPGWLWEMVAQGVRAGVGAVGAKLIWPEGMVQHGGVVLGIEGYADHVGNTYDRDDPGYAGLNLVARRYSAVTAACLLIRRETYLGLGGMDARAFAVAFNDTDLCLRLGARGLGVVWTPEAVLTHAESVSRGSDILAEKRARARREMDMLRARWGARLLHDPHYNPNLNLDGAPYEGLALVPRRPWRGGLPME